MSDPTASHSPTNPKTPPSKADSSVRSAQREISLTFQDDLEPTDDSPTIISKNKPQQEVGILPSLPGQGVLAGSLRGRRLAHFELVAPIGVGGMAAVIKARDTQLDRHVALKILPPEMAQDPENIRRFHQEARAAAKLDHENIARVFFCGEDQRLHFIAFEFVEGENLRTILERRHRLPVGEAVRYILQIATGLEHAASRGVVHRDIKPSNIIISPNGRAKLVDMGLARSMEPQTDQLTQSGVTLGTFDYISPEQALEPREADARSDIYSLGCTLYHMLTGTPPVPEGTAAKKLHHHQHIAPVDPRQLNSDIPDEVVLVLMRMMAKDPRKRYQHPIELIQHLMKVAQKVGAGEDMPEGVLFLDTPLPGPPRPRPLLTLALAILGLGVLLLVLSVVPGSRTPLPPPNVRVTKSPDPVKEETSPPVKSPAVSLPGIVSTFDELRQSLADPQKKVIVLEGTLQIPKEGLSYQQNRDMIVKAEGPPAVLKFRYHPAKEENELVAGMKLEGGKILFQNIRFEIDAPRTPLVPVGMLAVRGAREVEFQNCTFAQTNYRIQSFLDREKQGNRAPVPLASVLIDSPNEELPVVIFKECFWQEGQGAVALQARARVEARNCAFGPHGVLFHLRGNSRDSLITLDHCSALVVYGPAFRLDHQSACHLGVSHSIFSRPEPDPQSLDVLLEQDEPQLIRQTEAKNPLVSFEGIRNRYHNLNALWVWPDDAGFHTLDKLEDFIRQLKETQGQDVESMVLAHAPFPANALQLVKAGRPQQAFQVRNLLEVRLKGTQKPLGLERCAWGEMKALPKLPDLKLKDNEKIVDPEAEDQPNQHIYRSLDLAILRARPGDVLLLKHGSRSREIEVLLPPLEDTDLDLTLRPFPGSNPVLVAAEKASPKSGLFRLGNGKLHFEHLEIEVKQQAMVALDGTGQVSFKQCVLTLNQPERRFPLSVCTVLETEGEERIPGQISFQDCFIRGEGDAVLFRTSRPMKIEARNTLLGLAGSFLNVQAAARTAPPDALVQVELNKVSAFFGDPFVVLKGRKGLANLVPTLFEQGRENLLVSLAEKPLAVLESVDTDPGEEGVKKWFDWKLEKNAYVNLDRLLEVQRPDAMLSTEQLKAGAWMNWDRLAEFHAAKFNLPFLSLRPYSSMTPEHFRPRIEYREELLGFGAGLDSTQLPPFTLPRRGDSDN